MKEYNGSMDMVAKQIADKTDNLISIVLIEKDGTYEIFSGDAVVMNIAHNSDDEGTNSQIVSIGRFNYFRKVEMLMNNLREEVPNMDEDDVLGLVMFILKLKGLNNDEIEN